MQISAKNQIKGKVTSVIHGTSYSQVAVEQTDADGNTTNRRIIGLISKVRSSSMPRKNIGIEHSSANLKNS